MFGAQRKPLHLFQSVQQHKLLTQVVATDSYGCISSDSVVVSVNQLPNVVLNSGNDTTICINDSISLTVTGAYNYSWNVGTPNNNVSDQNLEAYWKLDNNSGMIAYDTSGNSRDGTISGATWTTGKLGSALSLMGWMMKLL
ncbi:MAG: hypothetical protein CM15mP65_21990 [Crocinitomicaceae bacterium]|nr:MAG: hypothetical protein CM15mP65_21990 [Crocinitomicaceae bacterium]